MPLYGFYNQLHAETVYEGVTGKAAIYTKSDGSQVRVSMVQGFEDLTQAEAFYERYCKTFPQTEFLGQVEEFIGHGEVLSW